jgi:propionyl-CoA carboxylase beta chain
MKEQIEKLSKKKDEALLGGGIKRIADQHKKGKLTARERLDLLLDTRKYIPAMVL